VEHLLTLLGDVCAKGFHAWPMSHYTHTCNISYLSDQFPGCSEHFGSSKVHIYGLGVFKTSAYFALKDAALKYICLACATFYVTCDSWYTSIHLPEFPGCSEYFGSSKVHV
jgi:hypothetical protein